MGAPVTPEMQEALKNAVEAVPRGRLSVSRAAARQAFRLMQIKLTAAAMMEEAAEHSRYCPQAFSAVVEWCDDGIKELMQRAQEAGK